MHTLSIRHPQRAVNRLALILFSAVLASCGIGGGSAQNAYNAAAPVKTTANTGYRTPRTATTQATGSGTSSFAGASADGLSISRVPVNGPFIAITFDDGPHGTLTPQLLDMLRQRNIKATFFCVGQCVQTYPDIARRIVAEGHEIANHSWSHKLLTKMGDAALLDDMGRTHQAIINATGVTPKLLRPPYGALHAQQRTLVNAKFGYPSILWSVDPLDWKKPGSAAITQRILAGTDAGGIILAHDIHAGTIAAMPETLDGLLKRGYRFVTVSQLLAMKTTAAPATAAP